MKAITGKLGLGSKEIHELVKPTSPTFLSLHLSENTVSGEPRHSILKYWGEEGAEWWLREEKEAQQ